MNFKNCIKQWFFFGQLETTTAAKWPHWVIAENINGGRDAAAFLFDNWDVWGRSETVMWREMRDLGYPLHCVRKGVQPCIDVPFNLIIGERWHNERVCLLYEEGCILLLRILHKIIHHGCRAVSTSVASLFHLKRLKCFSLIYLIPSSAPPLLRPLIGKKSLIFICKMSTFLRSNSRNSFGFSLFSVDSGDQKIKTFYTFSAFRPRFGNLFGATVPGNGSQLQ